MTKARIGITAPIRASAALARSAPSMWYRTVMRSERHSFPRHSGPDGPDAVRCPRSRDSRLRPATSQPAHRHHTASEQCRRPRDRRSPPRFDLSLSGPAPSLSGPKILAPTAGSVKAVPEAVAGVNSASPLRRKRIADFVIVARCHRRAPPPADGEIFRGGQDRIRSDRGVTVSLSYGRHSCSGVNL